MTYTIAFGRVARLLLSNSSLQNEFKATTIFMPKLKKFWSNHSVVNFMFTSLVKSHIDFANQILNWSAP